MPAATVKEEARRLIDQLPDDATWEDVQHQLFVRQRIEAGLADAHADRVVTHEGAKREFGLETT